MTPRTGPKHSVTWNHEPGCTPTRTPGDHMLAPRSRGSTNHRSPSSSVVRPRCNFVDGSPINGPTTLPGSVGLPTTKLRVALKGKTKRDALYPAMHFLYRYAMTRDTFEPVSFVGEFYASEGEAKTGAGS